jgi:hypothetical protein
LIVAVLFVTPTPQFRIFLNHLGTLNIMDDLKGLKTQIRDSGSAESQSVDGLIAEKRGTPEDQKDMHRMGKMQEMRVRSNSVQKERTWLKLSSETSNLCLSLATP